MENLTLPQIDCKAGDPGVLSLNEISTGFGPPLPIIAEPLDNWRVLGEINTGIIKRLTIQQGATE